MSNDAQQDGDEGPSYAGFRQVIDDPLAREALLRQVRGTVQGLRQAFLLHVVGALLAIVAMVVAAPGGWLGAWRDVVVAALLFTDLVAFAGMRSVIAHPARWVAPLLVLDLVVIAGLATLSAFDDAFSLAWLLPLLFPLMLAVHLRDAKAIAPLLEEHAAWRREHGA